MINVPTPRANIHANTRFRSIFLPLSKLFHYFFLSLHPHRKKNCRQCKKKHEIRLQHPLPNRFPLLSLVSFRFPIENKLRRSHTRSRHDVHLLSIFTTCLSRLHLSPSVSSCRSYSQRSAIPRRIQTHTHSRVEAFRKTQAPSVLLMVHLHLPVTPELLCPAGFLWLPPRFVALSLPHSPRGG